jgi:2,3-bisphosphoglycerate-independent phosphoglycerate mutase
MNKAGEDYRMLIMPDHPTPIRVRTHTSNPVPYMLYDSTNIKNNSYDYNEKCAKESGIFMENGHEMMKYLLSND